MTESKGQRPYTPRMPAETWAAIAPYVHDVVARAAPQVPYTASQLYLAVTPMVRFAIDQHMGFDDEDIWDPFTVERFVQHHLSTYNRASKNTMRARLRRVSEALLDGDTAARVKALGKADASKPYSERDIALLDAWASGQRTDERQTSARALLALGLGAGLTGAEIIGLQTGAVTKDGDKVIVQVLGASARQVPVEAEWADELMDRVAFVGGDGWMFRSDQRGGNINLITDFISRNPPEVQLQTRRMRATWLAHHLEVATPLKTLLRIAGLQSAEALDRILPFVD